MNVMKRHIQRGGLLLLLLSVTGCGTTSRHARRADALAEAQLLAPAHVRSAVAKADEAVLRQLRARLDAEISPLWAAERRVHMWFAGCLERLGAVGQSDAAAVDACRANQAELADALQTLRGARPALADMADSLRTLESFLVAVTDYLDTALVKPTPKTHARYAAMVDAHNRWVKATTSRRSEIMQTLPAVLEGASTQATPSF